VLRTPPTALDPNQSYLEEIMSTIINHPAREAHPRLDAAARHRADRLAEATTDQIQAALAYLSMIDPEAFEIALTAVAPACADDPEDDELIPLCRACGAPVGIFPGLTLNWRHFRGDATTSGPHHTYDPGHDRLCLVRRAARVPHRWPAPRRGAPRSPQSPISFNCCARTPWSMRVSASWMSAPR
jgi:hypothetical protein